MFTFGRDHELKYATSSLKAEADVALIAAVVNAVHDLLEGKSTSDSVRLSVIGAFSLGRSGVWEQAGSWLRQVSVEYPEMLEVWRDLSQNNDGKVRFRVACFMNNMPRGLALEIGNHLKDDCHKGTREMAEARLDEIGE